MSSPEPTETDLARWAKWDDLRARQAEAKTDEERAALKQEEDELREQSIDEMLAQDLAKPEQWFWLSFCDPNKLEGSHFLGVAIVQGGGLQEAIQNAWAMGINPGGEVAAFPLSEGDVPDEQYRRRLMSKDELEEAGLA